jgi:TonB family protein
MLGKASRPFVPTSVPARVADPSSSLGAGWTWLASLVLHACIVALFGWVAFRSMHAQRASARAPRENLDLVVAVDLPTVEDGVLPSDRERDRVGEAPRVSGGDTVARVDTGARGHGGDLAVDKPAIHLSDRDERLRLAGELLSRLDRDQAHRIRSSSERASWEDRRSTTHPSELTFIASGDADRMERRALAAVDPSRGALVARSASREGGNLGTPDSVGAGDGRSALGGVRIGIRDSSPGHGVSDGRPGEDHRASAAVAYARPDVALGPVSVLAAERNRVRDDVDAEQEVATVLRALVHASTAGGLAGEGRGGSGGGGDPGAGGDKGAGSHPQPLGDGASDWFDINTSDPRLVPYFRRVQARIEPLWADAFPRSALLELKQGTVILEFTIAEDGTVHVTWPPLRPSGFDEFDRNCANAIRKAAPFEPIPRELGRTSLRIRAPFVASSPIVH